MLLVTSLNADTIIEDLTFLQEETATGNVGDYTETSLADWEWSTP